MSTNQNEFPKHVCDSMEEEGDLRAFRLESKTALLALWYLFRTP